MNSVPYTAYMIALKMTSGPTVAKTVGDGEAQFMYLDEDTAKRALGEMSFPDTHEVREVEVVFTNVMPHVLASLVAMADDLGIKAEDLDEEVSEAVASMASGVNNGGVKSQIDALLAAGDNAADIERTLQRVAAAEKVEDCSSCGRKVPASTIDSHGNGHCCG